MKKLLFLVIFIGIFTSVPVYAAEVSAEYACVLEPVTGEYLYAKNGDTRYSMASTTKIMTALVALENCPLEDVVTVSPAAASAEGSSAYLKSGEKITMENLLYGLMLNSGNDAAAAIAEHVGGTQEKFVEMMNRRAQSMGLSDTAYKNPSGLDADGHYTTAAELARVGAEAMKNPQFRKIAASKVRRAEGEGEVRYFSNHNKLLSMYPGAAGIKTGYTKAVGRCLVSAAERGGVTLIGVTLNAPDDWNDHKKMLDEGFGRVKTETAVEEGQILKVLESGGEEYALISKSGITVPTIDGKKGHVEIILHTPQDFGAGTEALEKAGYAEVFRNGRKIAQTDILSRDKIPPNTHTENKKSFLRCLREILRKIYE